MPALYAFRRPQHLARLLVLLFLFCSSDEGRAQSGTREADSLRTYRLSEIVISDDETLRGARDGIHRIPVAAIVREDAGSAADLIRLIPGAHLQTNSRGEALLYLRNSGERQVAVFFDGALLNVPWDYRVDMSLIPVGMLGGMTVTRGIPSVVYGTNVIGGAVNLQSRERTVPGSRFEFGGRIGYGNARSAGGTYMTKSTGSSLVSSGWLFATDGQALPSAAELPYSQLDASMRTNTDRRIGNAFVRVGHQLSAATEIGVSLLHVESEKGVAPEGHIDPNVDQVRFWRYPDWRNSMLIASAIADRGEKGDFRATLWIGRFSQRIEQFGDVSYQYATDSERDRDHTVGLRMTASPFVGRARLRVALNGLASIHRQTDSEMNEAGAITATLERRYRQVLFSGGLEYETSFAPGWETVLGVSLDGNATPETGDKPPRSASYAPGMTAVLARELRAGSVRLSAGRKVRFPTMRELFGEALQRFVLNPDLRPETSLEAELVYERHGSDYAGEISGFFRRTFDTIDQEAVIVDGVRKRRRINLDGSRVWGFEAAAWLRMSDVTSADGHITWMDPVGYGNGIARTLNEKPRLLSTANLLFLWRWGASFQASWIQTGSARALGIDNTQVRLSPSTMFNFRAAFRKYFSKSRVFVEVFLGVRNATDAVNFPQLGLPSPGREWHSGMDVSF